MILFITRGDVDSDRYIKHCYGYYRDITGDDDLPKEVQIVRENGKKPRLDVEDVHFNLSHSHGLTVLGISFAPIGVDVEKVRPIDREKFSFIKADSDEEFFERWTERESYVKLTGEGLRDIRKEIPSDAHFDHFPLYGGEYHLCVCADEQNIRAYEMRAEDIM